MAEISGLSVRTVQRIERGGHAGLASVQRLAAALGVEVEELREDPARQVEEMRPVDAVTHALRHYADFDGRASRAEFWWFTLAVAVAVTAVGQAATWAAASLGTVALVPWLAVAARRLRDAGQTPWWLLILLAPVGGLVAAGFLLAMPSEHGDAVSSSAGG